MDITVGQLLCQKIRWWEEGDFRTWCVTKPILVRLVLQDDTPARQKYLMNPFLFSIMNDVFFGANLFTAKQMIP
jgi:hypothetical protein